MAKPPRIPTLRETDLAIKDGPIDGAALRDAFKRYFALVNASNDATNKSLSKGLTIADNLHCDTLTVSATHATPFTVRLQTIKAAKSCLVTGGDTLLPFPLAAVQMLQPAQTGGNINACSVTVYFQVGSGTANVRLWLFEDGQQATSTLTFLPPPAVRSMVDASSNAGASINNNTVTDMIYGTETRDTTSSYDPTTGVFTVPSAGDYHFDASIAFALALTATVAIEIKQNGTIMREIQVVNPGADQCVALGCLLHCAVSDAIKITVFQNSGLAKSLDVVPSHNYFNIIGPL